MPPASLTLRVVECADAARLAEIYAPNVLGSNISFELEAPDSAEIAARIGRILPVYPWLVAEIDGVVVGYAYASENRTRRAYRWGVEVTIYLAPEAKGRGIGRTLYGALFDVLRHQHFINAYGIITLPNAASVGIHESFGFRHAGTFTHAGYKNGAWLDVGWYQLALQQPPTQPEEPIPFAQIDRDALTRLLGGFALTG